MALRGKKPEAIEKRLKMLLYGPAGSGKTTAAIQFPRPYLIDTERGSEEKRYVELLNKSGGMYFGPEEGSTDPDEVIKEVTELLSTDHPYRTLIIDPLTTLYADLLDKSADKVGTDFGKHKGPADRKMKHLLTLLVRLDMNVIITSHAKAKWERAKDSQGKDTVIEAGLTFDCYSRLDYLFDLVLEVGKRGTNRVAKVIKTRIEGFPEGEIFPLSYEEIAKKYGPEVLERAAVTVELADDEQIAEITRLIGLMKVNEEVTGKWLDKAGAENWHEMPAKSIQACIDYLKNQANKGAA